MLSYQILISVKVTYFDTGGLLSNSGTMGVGHVPHSDSRIKTPGHSNLMRKIWLWVGRLIENSVLCYWSLSHFCFNLLLHIGQLKCCPWYDPRKDMA